MNDIFDQSFRKILAMSASDAPTPGGGSVTAMIGALGTAMTAMVGNLTVGKEKYRAVEGEAKEITGMAYYLIYRLEKMVAADIEVFNNYMAAYKLPRNNEQEKAKREAALQEAAKAATKVPLQTAKVLLEALSLTERMSKIGNKMVISDAGVAAYTIEAAINAVLLNVDINLPAIADQNFAAQAKKEKEEIKIQAKKLKEQTIATVHSRINDQ